MLHSSSRRYSPTRCRPKRWPRWRHGSRRRRPPSSQANATLPAGAVFDLPVPARVRKPLLVVAPPGHTLDSLRTAPATIEQLAHDNRSAPLRPGTVLATAAPRTVPVAPPIGTERTIGTVARMSQSAVYCEHPSGREIGLVPDNWSQPGLVAANLKISIGDYEVTTTGPSSLDGLFDTFRKSGATFSKGAFAQAIAGISEILAPGVTGLASNSLVVPVPSAAPPAASLRRRRWRPWRRTAPSTSWRWRTSECPTCSTAELASCSAWSKSQSISARHWRISPIARR